MLNLLTNYLEPIAYFIYFIGVLFYFYQRGQKPTLVLLCFYLIVTIALTLGSFWVGTANYNIWIYDLTALLTCVCIGVYFYQLYQTRQKKLVVLLLALAYIGYTIFRNLTIEGLRLFDSIGFSLASASVVIYVFMYFHQLLKNVSEISILKDFNFWLAAGYLIYYVGSFIIFVSFYYLTNKVMSSMSRSDTRLLTALWGLHNVLLFLGALSLLTGSLWVIYRKKSA